MPLVAANKKDFGIAQIAKQFNAPYGMGKTVSALKKVILITTDKNSAKLSKDILDDVNAFAKSITKNKEKLDVTELKKLSLQANNNIQFVSTILSDINDIIDGGGKLQVDDDSMKTFIHNFKEVKKQLLYLSDYFNLLIEINVAKKEISEGKGIKYTLDELLDKLKSAA